MERSNRWTSLCINYQRSLLALQNKIDTFCSKLHFAFGFNNHEANTSTRCFGCCWMTFQLGGACQLEVADSEQLVLMENTLQFQHTLEMQHMLWSQKFPRPWSPTSLGWLLLPPTIAVTVTTASRNLRKRTWQGAEHNQYCSVQEVPPREAQGMVRNSPESAQQRGRRCGWWSRRWRRGYASCWRRGGGANQG